MKEYLLADRLEFETTIVELINKIDFNKYQLIANSTHRFCDTDLFFELQVELVDIKDETNRLYLITAYGNRLLEDKWINRVPCVLEDISDIFKYIDLEILISDLEEGFDFEKQVIIKSKETNKVSELLNNQQPIDPEIDKVIADNLWELYDHGMEEVIYKPTEQELLENKEGYKELTKNKEILDNFYNLITETGYVNIHGFSDYITLEDTLVVRQFLEALFIRYIKIKPNVGKYLDKYDFVKTMLHKFHEVYTSYLSTDESIKLVIFNIDVRISVDSKERCIDDTVQFVYILEDLQKLNIIK